MRWESLTREEPMQRERRSVGKTDSALYGSSLGMESLGSLMIRDEDILIEIPGVAIARNPGNTANLERKSPSPKNEGKLRTVCRTE